MSALAEKSFRQNSQNKTRGNKYRNKKIPYNPYKSLKTQQKLNISNPKREPKMHTISTYVQL